MKFNPQASVILTTMFPSNPPLKDSIIYPHKIWWKMHIEEWQNICSEKTIKKCYIVYNKESLLDMKLRENIINKMEWMKQYKTQQDVISKTKIKSSESSRWKNRKKYVDKTNKKIYIIYECIFGLQIFKQYLTISENQRLRRNFAFYWNIITVFIALDFREMQEARKIWKKKVNKSYDQVAYKKVWPTIDLLCLVPFVLVENFSIYQHSVLQDFWKIQTRIAKFMKNFATNGQKYSSLLKIPNSYLKLLKMISSNQ